MTTEIVENAAHLWENLTQLSDKFSIPELQQLTDKLICYQNGKYHPDGEQGQPTHFLELIPQDNKLSFSQEEQTDSLTLSGSVHPFRLHDVYAADFTIGYKNQEIELNQLHRFNPQGCLLPTHIQASLGQTLLLYTEPLDSVTDYQTLANECVQAFWQTSNQASPRLINKGKLFGSPIFEYEQFPKYDAQNPNELNHILVWLGTHSDTLERADKANRWLINLLNCRRKILFASHQAHQSHNKARQLYNQLENKSPQFEEIKKRDELLIQLESGLINTLPKAFEYSRHLRDIEEQRNTLNANAKNYTELLTEIRSLSKDEFKDDLKFLEVFHTRTCKQYQQQTDLYLNYLKPGHHLFEQMIATTRGIVEIENQKQGQEFQFMIAFVGFTLGISGLSAMTILNPTHWLLQMFEKIQPPLYEIPQFFSAIPEEMANLSFHLMVGGGLAFIISRSILYLLHSAKK
ncbi:MAG: hypothetical protein B6247_25850 [Candidatus Parabeggiatoa sp. nov. 2]|nr:MAG: hypothetical protein B6247_25850 [Beggiatoa sp. 4572_84]